MRDKYLILLSPDRMSTLLGIPLSFTDDPSARNGGNLLVDEFKQES